MHVPISVHLYTCVHECIFMHMYMGMAREHVHANMPYLRPSQGCVQVKQATTLTPGTRHRH